MSFFHRLFARKRASVLEALKAEDQQLALTRLRNDGDLKDKDEHGNVALHYAAALGYLDVVEGILDTGFPVDPKNKEGQTPLVYAMEYGQLDASKLLWKHQAARVRAQGGLNAAIIRELCSIGVDRTKPPTEASSGFFQKNSPLEYDHHPRARQIGEELYASGKMPAMLKMHAAVKDILGGRAAHDLSACWHEVGEWLH